MLHDIYNAILKDGLRAGGGVICSTPVQILSYGSSNPNTIETNALFN